MEENTIHESYADRYKFIVEETIKETNRILHFWRRNDKRISLDDKVSIFRTNLSKYFKQQFGYMYYNQYIRWCAPMPIIDVNWNLMGISFSWSDTRQMNEFQKYIEAFDFVTYNKQNKVDEIVYNPVETPINKLIDYERLQNIKFTTN